MATKTAKNVETEEVTVNEGQLKINIGRADSEYIHALGQLFNVPNASFEFKVQVKRLLTQLKAETELKTIGLREAFENLSRLRNKVQRAERFGTLTVELADELDSMEETTLQKQKSIYKGFVVIDGPKISHSLRPKPADLAKSLRYQSGNQHIETDFLSMYTILFEELVDEKA